MFEIGMTLVASAGVLAALLGVLMLADLISGYRIGRYLFDRS
jgi:hypothetical protein